MNAALCMRLGLWVVFGCQFVDCGTTIYALRHFPGAYEQNPLLAWAGSSLACWIVISLLKCGLAYRLLRAQYHRFYDLILVATMVTLYANAMWWNISQLVQAHRLVGT